MGWNMKTELSRVGVLQAGKIFGVLYGGITLLFAPFILLGALIGEGGALGGIIVVIVMVVVYPAMGFIGGVLMAALYNFVANLIGGFEFTLNQIDE
jgi:hypothetical protein